MSARHLGDDCARVEALVCDARPWNQREQELVSRHLDECQLCRGTH